MKGRKSSIMRTFTWQLFIKNLSGTREHITFNKPSFGRKKSKMNYLWTSRHIYKMRAQGRFGSAWNDNAFSMDRRYGGYNDKKHIHRHSWSLAGHDMYRHVWMADEIKWLN